MSPWGCEDAGGLRSSSEAEPFDPSSIFPNEEEVRRLRFEWRFRPTNHHPSQTFESSLSLIHTTSPHSIWAAKQDGAGERREEGSWSSLLCSLPSASTPASSFLPSVIKAPELSLRLSPAAWTILKLSSGRSNVHFWGLLVQIRGSTSSCSHCFLSDETWLGHPPELTQSSAFSHSFFFWSRAPSLPPLSSLFMSFRLPSILKTATQPTWVSSFDSRVASEEEASSWLTSAPPPLVSGPCLLRSPTPSSL